MAPLTHKDHGMSERAWAVYVDQTVSSWDAVAKVIRISQVEELRRFASDVAWSVSQLHQIHDRANELDPDGAQ